MKRNSKGNSNDDAILVKPILLFPFSCEISSIHQISRESEQEHYLVRQCGAESRSKKGTADFI